MRGGWEGKRQATRNMTTDSIDTGQVNPQALSLISARIDPESRLGVLLLLSGRRILLLHYKIVYIVPLLPRLTLLSNQAKGISLIIPDFFTP